MSREELERRLAEQVEYYRAIAGEYDEHAISPEGAQEVYDALEAFAPQGRILELTCGQGFWTERLLRDATGLTAVDAAPEMIAIAKDRIGGDPRARFIQADLFQWQPAERYDVVFFGFWISHVPEALFEPHWAMIERCLEPGGRVFFVDDNYRTPQELIEGEASSTVERRLKDGTAFRAIKIPYEAPQLEAKLRRMGWDIQVTQSAGAFYWGQGSRAT